MSANAYTLHSIRILEYASGTPYLSNGKDAADAIGDAISQSANLLVVPVENLDPKFFSLRTGLAGEIIQKFVTYRLRLTVIGDLSEFTAESTSLRDFVREANRGQSVWFLQSIDELHARLEIEQ